MTAPSLTSIHAQLLFARSIRRVEELGVVLDALSADEHLAPRRWGPAPGVHDPYDRAAVLDFAAKATFDNFCLRLHRNSQPRTEVGIYDGQGGLGCVSIDINGPITDAAEVFASIDRIAACLPLEFGCVDLRFADAAYRNRGVHVRTYFDCGPPAVYPRTYFGPRLLALLGHAVESTGGVTHAVGDSVRALDLVTEPWGAQPEDLSRARVSIDRALRLAGILARPASQRRTIPGPRWVPPQPLGDVR